MPHQTAKSLEIDQIRRNGFEKAIKSSNKKKIQKIMVKYRAADVADVLAELTKEDIFTFFKLVSIELAAEVLSELNQELQSEIIEQFHIKRAADIVEEMDSDEAADLLGELSKESAQEIIKEMEQEEADNVSELLSFDEDTAGGIMSKEFVSIPEKLTVSKAITAIRKHADGEELHFSEVYVVDPKGKLAGMVTTDLLILNDPKTKIKKIRDNNVIAVSVDTDQEKVAEIISKYDLSSLPVIDYRQRLVGVVTVDDVIDIIEEETSEDILKQAATVATEESHLLKGSVIRSAGFRLPWLLITLLGGFVTSYIIKGYSASLSDLIIPLSIIMSFQPMLLGMGGNIGTQSSTLMVRGIAVGEIKRNTSLHMLWRELRVGLLIGLLIGLLVTLFSVFFQTGHSIGLIIGIAMCVNVTFAATLGTIIPLGFRRLGIDPAIASGPIITTTIDILGLVIYFSLTLFLVKFLFPL